MKIQKYISSNFKKGDRNLQEKAIYRDFTPKESIKKSDETLQALHWALDNTKIKNIALTGPYGAGKSSIICSYVKYYNLKKYINISLATFDDKYIISEEANGLDDQEWCKKRNFEEELERGILKQLFYKVKAEKVPKSRYRKLHHVGLIKYVLGVIAVMLLSIALLYLAVPTVFITKLEEYKTLFIVNNHVGVAVLASVIVIFGIAYVVKTLSSKIFISEVTIGDVSAKAAENYEESIFNKNIDEILYFFERTKYEVVFIEDLDRFNNMEIFVKLRELNTILNRCEAIGRRIVFVYAIKDDLFTTEKQRTKFFDFIIPVIPVINTTNSEQMMRDMLGRGKTQEGDIFPENNISDDFINNVSVYIGDMRVLTCIINEFWIYKQKLKISRNAKLKDELIMAMVIYKNLKPDDFALIEEEKGDIKTAFDNKTKAIVEQKQELEDRKKLLELKQKDIAKSLIEIKMLILTYMVDTDEFVHYISTPSGNKYRKDMLSNDFDFDEIKNRPITVKYYDNGRYSSDKKIMDLENYSDEMKSLFDRYDAQKRYDQIEDEKIKHEIEKIDENIINLRSSSLQKLINEFSAEMVLPEAILKNKVLVFMLRHGYINEHYADYINYFHEGSVSRDEMNFVLSVRDFTGENNFDYPISHCKNTIDKLHEDEFAQKEALNFDIMYYLLKYNYAKNKLMIYLKQLSDRSNSSKTFIKEYIDLNRDTTNFFLELIFRYNEYCWKDLVEDYKISKEKKDEYLKRIFIACNIEEIKKNNCVDINVNQTALMKDYVEKDEYMLEKLNDVPTNKMQEVIRELNLCFKRMNLENVKEEIVLYIVQNKCYDLNYYMVEQLYKALGGKNIQDLITRNYYSLIQLNNSDLLDNIDDKFEMYVNQFIIERETNTEVMVEDMDEELARYVRNIDTIFEKKYVEAAWNQLSNQERYQLLYNQLQRYTLDEIANKFSQLGGVYATFAQRTRHKYLLHLTEYNQKLCEKLERKKFLSVLGTEKKIGSKGETEEYITGYVKAAK